MATRLLSVLAAACLGILALGTVPRDAPAAELVMFESPTCEWCALWLEEIGPVYPKTDEGRVAPLRRVSIHDPRPADLTGIKAIRYTPTFVLLEDGREVGRIIGYPGEDFFWYLLGELIDELRRTSPHHTSEAERAKPRSGDS